MPTFAELRAAAQNAASQGAQKANALKERYSSPSSSDTSYANHSTVHDPVVTSQGKKPPPPPPSRKAAFSPASIPSPETQHAPLPPSQTFRPSSRTSDPLNPKIDFRNLSSQEKAGLFSLLDEFFASRGYTLVKSEAQSHTPTTTSHLNSLTSKLPPNISEKAAGITEKASGFASSLQNKWGKKDVQPQEVYEAPKPVLWARPSTSTPPFTAPTEITEELPPDDPHTCSARTVSEYFSSSWSPSENWYKSDNPLPPILVNRKDMMWTASWSALGTRKEVLGAAIFEDCSRCTYHVVFDSRTGIISVKECFYRPIPDPWDGELLKGWAESFGEIIAQFAERAEAEGRPVARGECWDLANEAIRDIQVAYPDMPKPMYTTGRCHGHRIYYGRVGGKGATGRWRGGDGVIRRGDVVEWRKVTIKDGYTTFTLGNPDHTAIVISTSTPALPNGSPPSDGDAMLPTSLGSIEVIEQSLGKVPKRQTYKLTGMQEGEIWIYRSVGLVDYLGGPFEAEWPPVGGEEYQA